MLSLTEVNRATFWSRRLTDVPRMVRKDFFLLLWGKIGNSCFSFLWYKAAKVEGG